MRKKTTLLSLALALSLLATPVLAVDESVPGALQGYIDATSAPCEYRPLAKPLNIPYKAQLNVEQAREDAQMFQYLMDNAYSGREYWAHHGVDFPGLYRSLEQRIQVATSDVPTADLEALISKGLSDIQDGHLSIYGSKTLSFFRHEGAYFADVLLEKQQDHIVVLASEVKGVLPGMRYTGSSDNLFPTLSPRGKTHYLLGLLTAKPSRKLSTSFAGEARPLPLHRARIATPQRTADPLYSLTRQEEIPVVRVAGFSSKQHEILSGYESAGKELKEEKRIVLDITDNGGGSSNYSRNFFMNLGKTAHWMKNGAELQAPPVLESWANMDEEKEAPFLSDTILRARNNLEAVRSNPIRRWSSWGNGQSFQQIGEWPGQLVVLMNRGVASSGEATVAYSRSVKNSLLIGENTAGIGTFGEVRSYVLPNSGIRLWLPSKLFLSPGLLEGRGFLPDYWLDSDTPVAEIVRWLNHPDDYQAPLTAPRQLTAIDFERFENGLPPGFMRKVGANLGELQALSRVEQDMALAHGGKASLKLSADKKAGRFYYLGLQIPPDANRLRVRWFAKGQNIRREGTQFDNCYASLSFTDANGKRQRQGKSYDGTFDWKEDSVEVNLEKAGAVDAAFGIFLAKSGELWLDDLQFEVLP